MSNGGYDRLFIRSVGSMLIHLPTGISVFHGLVIIDFIIIIITFNLDGDLIEHDFVVDPQQEIGPIAMPVGLAVSSYLNGHAPP